jgi:hypothetical protein
MARFTNPVPQYLDGAGNPLVNAKLTFYASGTNTKIITYADELETIANTNPIILDSAARVPSAFFSGSARVILTADDVESCQEGVQIWDRDPVGGETELGDFAQWVIFVDYDVNDIVEGSDGKFYLSLTNANQGNDPANGANPADWEQINFLGVWNTSKTYGIGDVSQTANGNMWKSLTSPNISNDPALDAGTNWLPAIDGLSVPEVAALEARTTTVIPQLGGGALSALRINELQDGGAYDLPLANSVSLSQIITIDLPDEFKAFEPVVSRSGSDTISYSGGTDTSITFDSGSSVSITLTSDGVSDWRL